MMNTIKSFIDKVSEKVFNFTVSLYDIETDESNDWEYGVEVKFAVYIIGKSTPLVVVRSFETDKFSIEEWVQLWCEKRGSEGFMFRSSTNSLTYYPPDKIEKIVPFYSEKIIME